MKQETIDRLKFLARREVPGVDVDTDDFVVYDYSGSNVDDAYGMGEHAGETLLARTVLTDMGVEW